MMSIPALFAEIWFKQFIGIGELPEASAWVYWIDTAPANAKYIYSTSQHGVLHGIAAL